MEFIDPTNLQNKRELCPDSLHPNDAGHAILAEKIGEFIEKL